MIQRIQTLYLLGVVVIMVLTLCLPLAYFIGGESQFDLYAFGLREAVEGGEVYKSTIFMAIVMILAAALPLVTIFLFKNRLAQIRYCIVEFVLLVGSLIMEGVYYYLFYRSFADFEFHAQGMRVVMFLPLAAILLNYLALRAISHDEVLVRSLDRIR